MPKNGRIPTNGTQVFSIPNDTFGRALVDALRRYLNAEKFQISVRGRAKDRKNKGGCQETQPLHGADWLAVYVYDKNGYNMTKESQLAESKSEGWRQGYADGKGTLEWEKRKARGAGFVEGRQHVIDLIQGILR